MARQPLQNLGEVCLVLDSIDAKLESRDRLDDQRRLVDDAREKEAVRIREEMLHKVDAVGDRATVLESNWKSFFGETGGFSLMTKKTDEHSKKIDRLMWLAGMGFGIVITLQFILEHHK